LYGQRREPALLVRVTGVAPLAAQVYELERLRCGLCGTVFTAEPPAGVGEAKYDETAAAMIALLKYGCGLPFHRIERLEKALAIPLPAATQWEVVQQAAARLTPAFAELAEQAAEGSVLYNDDTTMRILNLTQEARVEALPPGARADRTGVFTSGLVAETAHGPIALFKTGPCHAGEHLAEVLDRREAPDPPIQMSDGLVSQQAGRSSDPGRFVHSACATQVRRRGQRLSRRSRLRPQDACARSSAPTSRRGRKGFRRRSACSCTSRRAPRACRRSRTGWPGSSRSTPWSPTQGSARRSRTCRTTGRS
jgi:transposase